MKSPLRNAAIPDPTPLLFLLAGTVAWFVWWKEDVSSTGLLVILFVACAIIVPAVIYTLTMRPVMAMGVLFVAVAMPRMYVELSGMKARPEHIICGMLLFALPYWFRKKKHQYVWMTADYLLLAYLAMHFFSSIFTSIQPGQTIKWCLQQAIVVLPYLFLRLLVTDRSSFQRVFWIALAVGAAEAAFAIICFYSNLLFDTEVGMEIGQYGSIPGTYGTQYEANLLGSFCGAASAMFLTVYLQQRRRIFLFGFALTFAGMAISLSRGALLATIIAMGVICLRGIQLRLFNPRVLARIAVVMLVVGVAVAPALYGLWSERLSSVDVTDISADDDTRVRVLTAGLALDGILDHPIVGNGTSSYQLQFSAADIGAGEEAGWIGNTELRILYDTGALGLLFFTGFLVYLVFGIKRLLRRERVPELEALIIAGLLYCVSFQFTEGTLLAFCWVHLGLLAAGLTIFQRGRRAEIVPIQGAIADFHNNLNSRL
jgi:O-antigen ligase